MMPASSVAERRVRYFENVFGILLYIFLFALESVRCPPFGWENIESEDAISRVLLSPLAPTRMRVA
jgi:hypothetical protein